MVLQRSGFCSSGLLSEQTTLGFPPSLSWESLPSNLREECLQDPTVAQACGVYQRVASACADNGLFVITEATRRSVQRAIKLDGSNSPRGKRGIRERDEHVDVNSKVSAREGMRPGLHHDARRTVWLTLTLLVCLYYQQPFLTSVTFPGDPQRGTCSFL